jgi:hypothetical protein
MILDEVEVPTNISIHVTTFIYGLWGNSILEFRCKPFLLLRVVDDFTEVLETNALLPWKLMSSDSLHVGSRLVEGKELIHGVKERPTNIEIQGMNKASMVSLVLRAWMP